MQKHTDSQVIHWNEDGSRTVETVETIYPTTKAQQAGAVAVLTLIMAAPVLPLVAVALAEKISEKRAARKVAKLKKQ